MKRYKIIVYLFICLLILSFLGCGESSAEKYKSKDKYVKQVVADVSEDTVKGRSNK